MTSPKRAVADPATEPGMKFKDIREQYYTTTDKASDVSRQLALVGFAAIWVFREGTTGVKVPEALVPSAALFGLALLFDALQYFIAARNWRQQADAADEKCSTDDDEFVVPVEANRWPRRFFSWKLFCVMAGYVGYIAALTYSLLSKIS